MTADLIVFDTGNAFPVHGTVVAYPVFRELSLLFDQYIQHHSCHGEAEEKDGYNQDL
ncbi:MAG: hypothetical protein P1P86_05890 [Bacteroidales bacterium]|nr:hypothetical protein [Bacteroidales bacterium]